MPQSKPTQRQSLDEYRAELDRLSVNFAAIIDQPLIIPKKDKAAAHHWRWSDLHRVLWQSLDFQDKLPTGPAGAERRIIRLMNPGRSEETVTNTMSMSLQLLMPGEIARPHRHTPVAFRFFLQGGAYTTVDGERCDMKRGDLVLTPYMQWHDHGNDGKEPAIWIDGLDFPLVRFLDAIAKEDTDAPKQGTERSGTTNRRFSRVGLRPAGVDEGEVTRSSLIHYRWPQTEAMLNEMAAAGDATPFDDVMIEYVNPMTGESVFTTIACCMQMIRPGIHTQERRQTCQKVYHVFSGSGRTVIDGKAYDWSDGDFFVIPSLSWHHFENDGKQPAILFSLQDFPTLKRLGLYWEQTRTSNRTAPGDHA